MNVSKKTITILKNGGVGVLPTDTLYGLVSSALSEKAVGRIYKLKKRNPKKPMIVLIAAIEDLGLFKIKLGPELKRTLKKLWPGKVSIILPCPNREMSYLHRGTKTLALRLPKPKWLRDLLKKTGPLSAPSANPEEMKPAETIEEAKNYFGNKVDFYVNKRKLSGLPSTLVAIKDDKVIIKRQGAAQLTEGNPL